MVPLLGLQLEAVVEEGEVEAGQQQEQEQDRLQEESLTEALEQGLRHKKGDSHTTEGVRTLVVG